MERTPLRLFVAAQELTNGGGLREWHAEAIKNLLIREQAFAVVPSDTCYALAAFPSGRSMSRRINQVLQRKDDPISLAFDGIARVFDWAALTPIAIRLLEQLSPGPLTLVCPLGEKVVPHIAGDILAAPRGTIGVRISDSRIECQLVSACNSPLTTVAIRDQVSGEPVRDLIQAREIVIEGLSRIENPPQIAVVEQARPFFARHSTVVQVPGNTSGQLYQILRAGAIQQEVLDTAIRHLSQWEISDFT